MHCVVDQSPVQDYSLVNRDKVNFSVHGYKLALELCKSADIIVYK